MRNEEKIKVLGLKDRVKYYYLKFAVDDHGRARGGIAAVCCIIGDALVGGDQTPQKYILARGVAYCTPKDQFDRKYGRTIALARAMQAMENKTNSQFMLRDNVLLKFMPLGLHMKSAYSPKPIEEEREFLVPRTPKVKHLLTVNFATETGGKCSCGADGYVCKRCKRALCTSLAPVKGGFCPDCFQEELQEGRRA
jgi:hypothetical protein